MLRLGIISEFDAKTMRARVSFEEDNIVSNWLPISVDYSLKNTDEFPVEVNTPVWCLMDKNSNDGIIGGAYYNNDVKPVKQNENYFYKEFSDGTKITYDLSNSKLTLEVSGGVEINGNLTVKGSVDVNGSVDATQDVKAGTISLRAHIHSYVNGTTPAKTAIPE